jgi:hypothetical protein
MTISYDGLVFTKMLYLVGGRHVDYPHAIELLIVKLADIDAIKMPVKPLTRSLQ